MTQSAQPLVLRHMTMVAAVIVLASVSPLSAAGLPPAPIVFGPDDTQRCLKCHGMANLAFQDSAGAPIRSFTVNQDAFRLSVHAELSCQQCHQDVTRYPHSLDGPRRLVTCATDCHATDSLGQPYSHVGVLATFQQSVHRRGLSAEPDGAPTCVTCHAGGNPHAIARATTALGPVEKMGLCVSCHEDAALMDRHQVDPEAVASYKRSFHYKAIRFGETNTAVCQDCHTVHGALPRDSAASSIATGHIAQTCGQQQCHPGATMNFAMSGANHLSLRIAREPVLWWLEKFFLLLTAGTMAMLIVGIALDVQRSFGWGAVIGRLSGWLQARWRRLTARVPAFWRLARRVLID